MPFCDIPAPTEYIFRTQKLKSPIQRTFVWFPGPRETAYGKCLCACSVRSNSVTPWTVTPPGSSIHGIHQARILEWVAISYSRRSSRPRNWTHVSCIPCIGRQILYHCTTWEALCFDGKALPVSLYVYDTISRLSKKPTTWLYHVLADQWSIFIHLEMCCCC